MDQIQSGRTPEEVTSQFDLTLGEIHTALRYYHEHPEEMRVTGDEDFVSGAAADATESYPGVVHLTENAPVGDVVRALRRVSRFASTDELAGHTLYVPGDWL